MLERLRLAIQLTYNSHVMLASRMLVYIWYISLADRHVDHMETEDSVPVSQDGYSSRINMWHQMTNTQFLSPMTIGANADNTPIGQLQLPILAE